ncbi:MAG: hypothetical protein ACYS47_11965 [Planctomycetota bacterium]
MNEQSGRRILPLLLALAFGLGGGCANVVYRGPLAKVGEEVSKRTEVGERVDLELDLQREALSPQLRIRPVRVREVAVTGRPLYREYGYYIPFNPAVKALEFVSFPVYLGIGTALLYRYWTFDEEDGGVGVGLPVSDPGEPLALEDTEWEAIAADVDRVVRDPADRLFQGWSFEVMWNWWALLGEILDPFANGRFPFASRTVFGPVGPIVEGPWSEASREEKELIRDARPTILVGGKPVQAREDPSGYFVLGLTALGPGPLEVTAEMADGKGGVVRRSVKLETGLLEAIREAEMLRKSLEADPRSLKVRRKLAALHARHGGVSEALSLLEAVAEPDPGVVAAPVDAVYLSEARRAHGAGDLAAALRAEALRVFHGEILTGAHRDWRERIRTTDRILVEGLGAVSFLERARSVVILAEREDADEALKTAALLALLRHESSPLVRWAAFWTLQRCGDVGEEILQSLADQAEDPFVKYRASKAAEAVRARNTVVE